MPAEIPPNVVPVNIIGSLTFKPVVDNSVILLVTESVSVAVVDNGS